MSVVFCGQALTSTESATSGQLATSQCLSTLPGRLGRRKFVLDGLGWKDKNQRSCVLLCFIIKLILGNRYVCVTLFYY